jgi:hypothetical protein
VVGVVLGLIAVRSGSVLPAVLFHLVYNSSLILFPAVFPAVGVPGPDSLPPSLAPWRGAFSAACVVLAGAGLAAVWRLGSRPAGDAA